MGPRIGLALALSVIIAWRAHRRGSLSDSGALAAVGVGTLVMGLGGLCAGLSLVGFFLTASALSRYRLADKQALVQDQIAKGACRDALQVLANGGPAAAFCLLHVMLSWHGLWAAALGSLAAAAADTWATEIGLLSRSPPRDLLTFRPVPAGSSGAVSLPGLLGMAAGALLVALLSAPCGGLKLGLAVGVAGVVGGMVDSLLGATWQERRHCPRCQRATEQVRHGCGQATECTGGIAGLDNDAVNALCTTCGGVAAALFWHLLR